ncbi:MAG: pyroglutamyl-peptidase I [Pseudomonadota bacterium]
MKHGKLPCVLLTGFDAFGGASVNPSWLAVQALDTQVIAGHTIVAAQLPTEFEASLIGLKALLKLHPPALVICTGQAGGRSAISLERVAININDARIADNAGNQPIDVPVIAGGPAAYFTTLPIKAMLETLIRAGIRAEISQSAGTFVCNHVFYGLMQALEGSRRKNICRGGFVHLPCLPEQGSPSMPLPDMVRGLGLMIECALNTPHDIVYAAGKVS